MAFELNRFIRGKLRNYLSWFAILFIPAIVYRTPKLEGVLLIFFGAFLRALASGFLEKEGRLSVAGPYRYTRNPLYIGTLLMVGGVAVSEDAWFAGGVTLALGFVVTLLLVRAEESVLSEKFPESFPIYVKSVGRFIPIPWKSALPPRLTAAPDTRADRFSKALFRKNRGYESIVAAVGLVALLFAVRALKTL